MCVTRAETEPQALMQTPCRAFLQGAAKFALHGKREAHPRALVARRTAKCKALCRAEGGTRAETEPQALMQTPCRVFLQGAAKFALHGKREAHPRALVARRTTKCKALCRAEGETRAETEPQALMQTPCRTFLQGAAKFALRRGGGDNKTRTCDLYDVNVAL